MPSRGLLAVLVRKELLEIFLSFKFVITFGICFVALLSSLLLSAVAYERDLAQFASSRSLNQEILAQYTSWQALGGQGLRVGKPPTPLSILSAGVDNVAGRVYSFSTRNLPHPVEANVGDGPILALFGELDPTYIVGMILSLFALLFAFDSISGEKERGTLKLLLANSVPRDTVLVGKLVGGFVSVLLALSIPLFLGLILVLLFFPIELTAAGWACLGLIYLTYALYLFCFFSLGVLISTRTHKPAASFLVALLVWVGFVNVFPKAAILSARQISPMPSVHEVVASEATRSMEYTRRATEQALELTREINRGEVSIADYGSESAKRRESLDREFSRLQSAEEAQLANRQRNMLTLSRNLSRLSPFSAMRYAVMNLAGTSLERDARFRKAVTSFRDEFNTYVYARAGGENVAQRVFSLEPPKALDLTGLPEFQFQEEPFGPIFVRALPDLGILFLYSAAFFLMAFFSFRHYDAR
jgi:ABC-type transport system involved in multi-copper enzyme maturation permease subunit